jgi:hypothetical protein
MMKYAWAVLASLLLGVALLSCSSRDDRNDIRAQYGDPDGIRRTGVDPFWSETWLYNRRGIAFEFRRTAGCGSAREVYLYGSYLIPIDTTGVLPPQPNEQRKTSKYFEKTLSPVAPR